MCSGCSVCFKWQDPFDWRTGGDCSHCPRSDRECDYNPHCPTGSYCDLDFVCTNCSECGERTLDSSRWPCQDSCSEGGEATQSPLVNGGGDEPTGDPIGPECETSDTCGDDLYCDGLQECSPCLQCYANSSQAQDSPEVCPSKCRSEAFPCQHNRHCPSGKFCDASSSCRKCASCNNSRVPLHDASCEDICPVAPPPTPSPEPELTECPPKSSGGKSGCKDLCASQGLKVDKFTKKLLLGKKTCRNACECSKPVVPPSTCPPQAKGGEAVCMDLCAELDLPFVRWTRKLVRQDRTCWNACECQSGQASTTLGPASSDPSSVSTSGPDNPEGPVCPANVKGGEEACERDCVGRGLEMVDWVKKLELSNGKKCWNACSCCPGKPAGGRRACSAYCTELGAADFEFGTMGDGCRKRCQCQCPKEVKNQSTCKRHCKKLDQDFTEFWPGFSSVKGMTHCSKVCQCSESIVFQVVLDRLK